MYSATFYMWLPSAVWLPSAGWRQELIKIAMQIGNQHIKGYSWHWDSVSVLVVDPTWWNEESVEFRSMRDFGVLLMLTWLFTPYNQGFIWHCGREACAPTYCRSKSTTGDVPPPSSDTPSYGKSPPARASRLHSAGMFPALEGQIAGNAWRVRKMSPLGLIFVSCVENAVPADPSEKLQFLCTNEGNWFSPTNSKGCICKKGYTNMADGCIGKHSNNLQPYSGWHDGWADTPCLACHHLRVLSPLSRLPFA